MKKVLSLIFVCAILLSICACSNLYPEPEPDLKTVLTTGMWSSDHRSEPVNWSDHFTWEEGYWIQFSPDGTFEGGYSTAAGDPSSSDYTIELKDAWGNWHLDGQYIVMLSVNHRFNMRLRYEDGVLAWYSDEAAFHQIK